MLLSISINNPLSNLSSSASVSDILEQVRDELEHLLDDDEDMAEMYLSDKLEEQNLENSPISSIHELDAVDEEVAMPDLENRHVKHISIAWNTIHYHHVIKLNNTRMILVLFSVVPIITRFLILYRSPNICDNDIQETLGESNALRRDSYRTLASTQSVTNKQLDVEELEMILEAYFVQIDGTLNKLSTVCFAISQYIFIFILFVRIMSMHTKSAHAFAKMKKTRE